MDSDCHFHWEVTIGEPFTLCTIKSSVTVAHRADLSGKRKFKKNKNYYVQEYFWSMVHLQSPIKHSLTQIWEIVLQCFLFYYFYLHSDFMALLCPVSMHLDLKI